ncbi:MAG: peptide deformylase [Elusimicrobia bacterium]|nr:peptide deformylase [Candidatus Obscuribacterium magneticum]
MSVRPLLLFPDLRLTHPSKTIYKFDERLKHLANDLLDTLASSLGVGLAAPQIGVFERISLIDLRKAKKGGEDIRSKSPYFIVNPVLLLGKGTQRPREGCLSVPELLANVRRYREVKVRAQDLHGFEIYIHAFDFEALALQHEMDHLDGKLFLDRVYDIKTDIFRRKSAT